MWNERETASPRVLIRRMIAEDIRAAWQIVQAAPEAAEWSEGSIRNSLLDQKTTAFVAVCGGQISGCIFGVYLTGEAEILNLAVKLSRRREGLGRDLVRSLLAEWQDKQVQKVFLEVRESNAGAIKLYEGLGFGLAGRRKGYYAAPEEDALVLERPLSK